MVLPVLQFLLLHASMNEAKVISGVISNSLRGTDDSKSKDYLRKRTHHTQTLEVAIMSEFMFLNIIKFYFLLSIIMFKSRMYNEWKIWISGKLLNL